MEIIIFTGLTASGKSKYALEYAKNNNGNIINADCIQVYNHLKFLNASPTNEDKQEISHFLYNFLDIHESFDVIEWLQLCVDSIISIIHNNKVPIIVGGTGFYISTLIEYIKYIKTNKSNFIDLFKNISYNVQILQKIKYKVIALMPTNKTIRYNVQKRLSKMLESDLILHEVKDLSNMPDFSTNLPITKTIGFKAIYNYLYKNTTKQQATSEIAQETIKYAKRQRTWIENKMLVDWKLV